MKTEEVKKMTPVDRFLYWIRERDQILKRRRAGKPKPWSDDPILQGHYFTNVRREDDRVTAWFRDNVREPLKDDPIVVFATIAFRWFNLPTPTGEYLNSHGYLTDWNTPKVIGGLNAFKDRGMKIFTGAFNISNSGSTKPKVNRVCEDYIQPVWEQRERLYTRLRDVNLMSQAFAILNGLPGLGGSGFMAGQVICDLAYTHVLRDAPDWDTWCSWGPGSKRGMNRVLGLNEDHPLPRAEWNKNLIKLKAMIKSRLGFDLHARDVQNCLCEYFKFDRALNGGGSKRKYNGHA
jgi:hypothetical protein